MVVIGLNPSTADADSDDATTRRMIVFARRTGCSAVHVVNLFAWRSTSPSVLRQVPDPVGPDNDDWIIRAVGGSDLIVAAWGTHADPARAAAVMQLLRHRDVLCLGTTMNGHPRHPLYVPNETPLQPYSSARHVWGPWQRATGQLAVEVLGSPTVQRFCPCGADEIARAETVDTRGAAQ